MELQQNDDQAVDKDPSIELGKQANLILSEAFCETDIPAYSFNTLKVQHPKAPVLRSLQKDHKDSWPHCKTRAVMPIKNSALESMDVIVSKVLTQYGKDLKFRIFDNDEARTNIKGVGKIKPGEFMFSLDIEAMYDSVPTNDKAQEIIKDFITKHQQGKEFFGFTISHIMKFIKFIFENHYIENEGKYFKMLLGIGTGSCSSPMIGDILVDHLYREAISKISLEPRGLALYVDDSWGIWAHGKDNFDLFVGALNSIWPSINFTVVLEDNNRSIIFLELKIKVNEDGSIGHEHHVKPTSSGKYLNYQSHCPMSMKNNIIKMEAIRVIKNCSNIEDIYHHLDNLRNNFIASGYPISLINNIILPLIRKRQLGHNLLEPKEHKKDGDKEFLLKVPYINEAVTRIVKNKIKQAGISARVVVTPGSKLKSHVSKKKSLCNSDKCKACKIGIPCNTRNFIYRAHCLKCQNEYIGCSARPASERLKEYESSIRLTHQNKRTALGQHKKEKHALENNDINEIYKFEILAKAKDPLGTFLKEALLIKKHSPVINGQITNGFVL